MWLVDGLRHPKRFEATIKSTKKMHYAVDDKGHRHVIGSTAFFTDLAAYCRWMGNIDRLAHDRYLMCTGAYGTVSNMIDQYKVPHVYKGRRFSDPPPFKYRGELEPPSGRDGRGANGWTLRSSRVSVDDIRRMRENRIPRP